MSSYPPLPDNFDAGDLAALQQEHAIMREALERIASEECGIAFVVGRMCEVCTTCIAREALRRAHLKA